MPRSSRSRIQRATRSARPSIRGRAMDSFRGRSVRACEQYLSVKFSSGWRWPARRDNNATKTGWRRCDKAPRARPDRAPVSRRAVAQAFEFLQGDAQRQVAGRKYIAALQREHQIYLGAPRAESAQPGNSLDCRRIVEPRQPQGRNHRRRWRAPGPRRIRPCAATGRLRARRRRQAQQRVRLHVRHQLVQAGHDRARGVG